jgi:hypothetical protein
MALLLFGVEVMQLVTAQHGLEQLLLNLVDLLLLTVGRAHLFEDALLEQLENVALFYDHVLKWVRFRLRLGDYNDGWFWWNATGDLPAEFLLGEVLASLRLLCLSRGPS